MKSRNYTYLFFALLVLLTTNIFAQKADTSKAQKAKPLAVHSPRKAAIMSTILPGLGQCYNKKYWKVPIVYAGLGVFGYFFINNRKNYKIASKELILRNDTSISKTKWSDAVYPLSYSSSDILVSANQYRRYAELSAVGFLVFYSFQIVDAYVDAHLFTFDVSDDLSLRVEPTILPWQRTPGVSFTLGFK